MTITQGFKLAPQGATRGITARVVVAEDAGHGQIQAGQPGRYAAIAIAQVANHQQGIRGKTGQEVLIGAVPLAVQITRDGDA